MFENLFHLIVDFVAVPSVARALAFGLVSGLMLTQWMKFQLPDWLSNRAHARWVRLIASLLAAFTVLSLWPSTPIGRDGLAMAVGTGLSTPFAYWLGVKVLYRFLPWTEEVMSARPTHTEPPK